MKWAACGLGQKITNGELPPEYFINGVSAFVLSNQMIIPFGSAAYDDFDFELSSNRIAIECAFGILVRRWGILWRPLEMAFNRRASVISCCMKLHNFCINRSIDEERVAKSGAQAELLPGRWEKEPTFDENGRPVEHLDTCRTSDESAAEARARNASGDRNATRLGLVQAIREAGLSRPASSRARRAARRS